MIIYNEKFIQDAKEPIIAHGCNAQGKMGSGVARVVRNTWPEAYEIYIETHDRFGLNLGTVIYAKSQNKIIANCITQRFYGRKLERYVDYSAVGMCFGSLNSYMLDKNLSSIAMPKIGAGLGGGDWNKIEELIKQEFDNKVEVVVYDPKF